MISQSLPQQFSRTLVHDHVFEHIEVCTVLSVLSLLHGMEMKKESESVINFYSIMLSCCCVAFKQLIATRFLFVRLLVHFFCDIKRKTTCDQNRQCPDGNSTVRKCYIAACREGAYCCHCYICSLHMES